MTEHFPGGSLKTVAKLIILDEHLDIYTDILGGGTWKSGLWYIDTHAGTGRTEIDESGQLVDGSAVRAIDQYKNDFDRFYLYELNPDHFELLHRTLARRFNIDFEVRPTKAPKEDFTVARSEDPEVIIMQMDSNKGVQKLIELEHTGSHWFTFIDPKGLTARKATIDALRVRGKMDILINYQTTGVLRNASPDADGYEAANRTHGDTDWEGAETPQEFVLQYKQLLEKNSAFKAITKKMENPWNDDYRFDLVFTSENDQAIDRMKGRMNQQELWRKAAEKTGQTGLNKWL